MDTCTSTSATRRRVRAILARAIAFTLVVLAVSCSRDRTEPRESKPVSLKRGERLTWNQVAASMQELQSHTYRLYIDGRETTLRDIRCTEKRDAGGFECSGLLPEMEMTAGIHLLELTSIVNGVESPRSAPIMVSWNSDK